MSTSIPSDACARCGHPADWHRHDDVGCRAQHPQPCSLPGTLDAQRGAPLAPFRCLGYDSGGIWLGPQGAPETGTVIGVGDTRELAIRHAIDQLHSLAADLWMALTPKHESARPCGCDPGAQHLCDEHAGEAI